MHRTQLLHALGTKLQQDTLLVLVCVLKLLVEVLDGGPLARRVPHLFLGRELGRRFARRRALRDDSARAEGVMARLITSVRVQFSIFVRIHCNLRHRRSHGHAAEPLIGMIDRPSGQSELVRLR